jgi:hypothetical protein
LDILSEIGKVRYEFGFLGILELVASLLDWLLAPLLYSLRRGISTEPEGMISNQDKAVRGRK